MGHTIAPMRVIVYDKIQQLKKLAKALREPERSAANALIYNIYQGISAISYANPLPSEIENNLIFTILIQEKAKNKMGIDNLTIKLFSQMISHKAKEIEDTKEIGNFK